MVIEFAVTIQVELNAETELLGADTAIAREGEGWVWFQVGLPLLEQRLESVILAIDEPHVLDFLIENLTVANPFLGDRKTINVVFLAVVVTGVKSVT